jgi:phosphohistidine phosphatase SixA
MRLYLMQHGKAVLEEVDPARPLSDQGRSDVRKMAEFLKESASMCRWFSQWQDEARETAEIVAATLGPHRKVEERPGCRLWTA